MSDDDFSQEGLRVVIGLPSAVILVVGGVIGVGIFVNPAVVARSLHSPDLALAAWVLGGLIAMLGALVYAELAARLPGTGGEYVYLRDTYGPLAGFLFGWTTLLVVHAGGLAAVAIVFARNLDVLAGGILPERAVVVSVLGALAAINCLGVKAGNGTQGILGALKVVAIAALIVGGLTLTPHPRWLDAPAEAKGQASDVLKAFGAAMIPVVFSYGGWQTANYVAGEMKNARRNLGRALVLGVTAVITLYLLVNIACIRVLGIEDLGKTLTPASDVLRVAWGPLGAKLAAGAIALSALAFLSQGMLTGPRVTFAMARDGLFFRRVGAVAEGNRAPVFAIVLLAAWTAVLALSGSYEQILSYVTSMNFLFFGLSASCLFVLRAREGRGGGRVDHGFRAPLHPWTTGLFVLACAMIVGVSLWTFPINSLVGYGILLLGVPPYLYWRSRPRLEPASP